ncbi:MAG TPA: hypothetical protein VE343_12460 [Streptosporangiaceae bacterium]|jgi:hypothetical protein|nr:hypothetical protein [Streptosporangiaceae bacterium]
MAGSNLAVIMIVVAAIVGLVAMLVPTLVAANRPYWRHTRPDSVPGKVRGGIHLGDPRSQGPPQGEEVLPPERYPEHAGGRSRGS